MEITSQLDFQRYSKFIESRKQRELLEGVYTEKHHILPKALGGGDEEENLIILTGREHFIAHLMLWKTYKGKMTFAFHMMNTLEKYDSKLTSKQYSKLKEDFSKKLKSRRLSESTKKKISDSSKGRIFSEATRKKLSKANKGRRGQHTHSEETKRKMRKAHLGKKMPKFSEEHKLKIGLANTGKIRTEEVRNKISSSLMGHKVSEETKNKMRESKINRRKEDE